MLKAFQTLDVGNIGSLTADRVRHVLRGGETFDDDEIDAALKTAYDPDHDCVHYDEWINKLLVTKRTFRFFSRRPFVKETNSYGREFSP